KNAAFPWPNATLILDITPDLALTRISYRTNNHLNPTFETSKSLTATAAILEDLDSYNLKGLYRLDGRKPLNKLATEALAILNPLLNL
ncbi:MAG: hypothetical protein LBI10_06845, partial [Deltaproteobacteria bacterium]|nr:hypothetical protein [Deltaproteobacteria bacterium]